MSRRRHLIPDRYGPDSHQPATLAGTPRRIDSRVLSQLSLAGRASGVYPQIIQINSTVKTTAPLCPDGSPDNYFSERSRQVATQMKVLDKLATSLGHRDEAPNQELATKIADSGDAEAVKELVDNLSNKIKSIQSDCIKVLYEIGERNPRLIAAHYKEFGRLLASSNNRLVWGGMTALDSIAVVDPKSIYSMLEEITAAADIGSVITRDHAVGILVKLTSFKAYTSACLPILLRQLRECPGNQFPMYVEMSLQVTSQSARIELAKVASSRLSSLRKESQRRRVEKALKALA